MEATLISRLPMAARRRVSENQPMPIEKLVLNRADREVRVYSRHNSHKKCIRDLSPEQVTTLLDDIKKSGLEIVNMLSLAGENYTVSSATRRLIE